MQPSTAIARQKSGTLSSDNSGAESQEKLTKKVDDGMARVHQAFATTDVNLGAYLRLQAMWAAGGKPQKDNSANNYSFAAVHSLAPRDGLEALLAVQMVGVHSLAMKFLAIAALEGQDIAAQRVS